MRFVNSLIPSPNSLEHVWWFMMESLSLLLNCFYGLDFRGSPTTLHLEVIPTVCFTHARPHVSFIHGTLLSTFRLPVFNYRVLTIARAEIRCSLGISFPATLDSLRFMVHAQTSAGMFNKLVLTYSHTSSVCATQNTIWVLGLRSCFWLHLWNDCFRRCWWNCCLW